MNNMRWLNFLLLLFILPIGGAWADAPPFKWLDEECDRDFVLRAVVMVGKTPSPRADARLAFHYQDERNFYLVYVTGGTVGLQKVQDGKPTPLGTPVLFKPYADGSLVLTLKRQGAKMAFLVNNLVTARLQDATFDGGKIGTSENGTRWTEVRYQPTEPVFFSDDFTRAGRAGEWKTVEGAFQLTVANPVKFDPDTTSNPFALRAAGPAMAVTTAGRWFDADYAFDAAVVSDSHGAFGLMVFFQDGKNYVIFRWFSNAANVPQDKAKQLIRVVNGQPQTLDAQPGGFEPGQWYKLTVKANDEKIQAFIDDQPACASNNAYFGQGKIGLYTETCRNALFDDVVVKPWDGSPPQTLPFVEEPKISEQFTREGSMMAWANPAAAWERDDANTAWHRGDFFGDASIAAALTDLRVPGKVLLCLHSPTNDFHQGYTWSLQFIPLERKAQWELWRQGTTVAKGATTWEGNPASVGMTFFRSGRQVRAFLAGQPAFTFTDAAPLNGRKVGFYTQGVPIPFGNLQVGGTNLLDETFSNAPTRWWQGRGAWRVEPRWPCDERWAWFTGGHSEAPTLWSKQAFAGDLTVELFAALQMNDNNDPQGYLHPSDLNVTICGDGKDLGSGYSFIFAGWRNRQTAILRQNKVVSSSTAARLVQPTRTNDNFHHHWYRLRIEKRKSLVRFFVDGVQVCEFHDSQPLPGGRVAFWTYKNGLALARARIWYESEMSAPPFPPVIRAALENSNATPTNVKISNPSEGIAHDFEGQRHGWSGRKGRESAIVSLDSSTASRGRYSLKIQTTISGGDFLAGTFMAPLSLEQSPVLRFDYKLPPQVKVNLYVRLNGRFYTLVFSGGEQDEPTPVLGSIKNVVADDQWHTATVNLLTLVRARFPDASPALDALAFACPDETYLRCGIGGNFYASAFNVDNFQIGME